MKFIFEVSLVVVSLYLGAVLPMRGGGRFQPQNFAFLLTVKNQTRPICVGVIDSETTFITASRCLRRVDQSTNKRTQSVASIFPSSRDVMVEMVESGKPGDAPSQGVAPFPELATVIARAKLPGLKVRAGDAMGALNSRFPSYTPWSMNVDDPVAALTMLRATGIVVGSGMMAAMMTVMNGSDCDQKLMDDVPERDVMASYLNLWENKVVETLDYFCATRAAQGGQYPPGNPCQEDLGAPFIFNNTVWGTLIGAWCVSDTNYTSLFRANVRSWDFRRFDSSLTDRPETTIPDGTMPPTSSSKTTKGGGDDPRPASTAWTNHVHGPIYSCLLMTIAVITMRK